MQEERFSFIVSLHPQRWILAVGHGPGVCPEDGDSAVPGTQAATPAGLWGKGHLPSRVISPSAVTGGAPLWLSIDSRGHRAGSGHKYPHSVGSAPGGWDRCFCRAGGWGNKWKRLLSSRQGKAPPLCCFVPGWSSGYKQKIHPPRQVIAWMCGIPEVWIYPNWDNLH